MRRRWIATLAGLAALGLAAPARAAGSGGGAGSAGLLVLILGLVAAAYLVTGFVMGRLQRTWLLVAGAEHLLLGILLGPAVPEVEAFEDLGALLPVIALVTGWIGLQRGMEVDLGQIARAPVGSVRVAIGDALVAGLLVAGAAHLFFGSGIFLEAVGGREVWMTAGVLACCAVAGSTGPIDVIERRYRVEGTMIPTLRRAARLADVAALLAFGLLFCIFHEDGPGAPITLRPTEWAVVAIGLGAALGLLVRPFLPADGPEGGRLLALAGMITFASGAAWLLRLSPLLVTLVLGAVLVNTSRAGPSVRATLGGTGGPVTLALLIFAGALWSPPPLWPTVAAACGFIVLRHVGKAIGTRIATWGEPMRHDLHRGLMGHGVVTIAMAIGFRLVYEGAAVDVAYTVILASVVFHDLAAPRVLRALLVDAGELQREQEA